MRCLSKSTFKVPQIDRSQLLNYLAIFAIGFGVLVRLIQYFSNRSLWRDEASLALNLVHRSYFQLLQPLDHNQAAPPGFLWIEKLALQLFGHSEYSLRLFPLIAGFVSLFALYKLGRWGVSELALPMAILLMACLKYPVRYSVQVKQYSSDVMVVLLLCLLLIPLRDRILKIGQTLLIGVLGAIAIWMAYPAIFALGGVEFANLILAPYRKRISLILNRSLAYCIWIVSCVSLYFLTTANAMKNQALQSAWGPEYPESITDLGWIFVSFRQFFDNPLGFHGIAEETAAIVFLIGCFAFLKSSVFRNNRYRLLILVSPILTTLVATYFHKYPFRTRLILFLTPFFILIIVQGISFLLFKSNTFKYSWLVGVIVAFIILLPPTIDAIGLILRPEARTEVRPIIEYIKIHKVPEDGIYVDSRGSPDQLKYYFEKYGFTTSDYIFGYGDFLNPTQFSEQGWQDFQQHSQLLGNKRRIWFIFSGLGPLDQSFVKPHLDRIGRELDYFKQPGAFTYFYQLNK
ncbi:MAG: glycosyltransferase family 39 protein [Leptolyngbyaceae cyanobacterium]